MAPKAVQFDIEAQPNLQEDVRRTLDRVRLQLVLLRRRGEPWAFQLHRQLTAQKQSIEHELERGGD
jgi:hypothetical protein